MKSNFSKIVLELYDSLKYYKKPKVCILEIKPQYLKIKFYESNEKYNLFEGYLSDCILIDSKEKYNKLINQIIKDKEISYLVEYISKTEMAKTFNGIFIGLVTRDNAFPIIIDNINQNFEILDQSNNLIFKHII